jgi:hypothetical protein
VGALVVALVAVLHCTGGFREDEVECEQAAAHLAKCCPGFDAAQLSCAYSNDCGVHYPALTVEDSKCIQSTPCDRLVATGVCPRAQRAQPFDFEDAGGSPPESTGVCP